MRFNILFYLFMKYIYFLFSQLPSLDLLNFYDTLHEDYSLCAGKVYFAFILLLLDFCVVLFHGEK